MVLGNMEEGKYFYIKNKLNNMVLSIEGESRDPGRTVVTAEVRPNDGRQLWYEDEITGTIRCRRTWLCLDINDDGVLVVNERDPARTNQQWLKAGDRLQMRTDNKRVLSVVEGDAPEGSTATVADIDADASCQKWTFLHVPSRTFYIKSQMHDKVLEIKKADQKIGAKVVMGDKSVEPQSHQLWYEDKFGVIHSRLNHFVLDASEGAKVAVEPFQAGNPKQLWTYHEQKVVNRVKPGQVFTIKGGDKKTGAKLTTAHFKEEPFQKWSLDFVS